MALTGRDVATYGAHALVVGADVDDGFISHNVDDVLMPLLDRRSRSADPQETP